MSTCFTTKRCYKGKECEHRRWCSTIVKDTSFHKNHEKNQSEFILIDIIYCSNWLNISCLLLFYMIISPTFNIWTYQRISRCKIMFFQLNFHSTLKIINKYIFRCWRICHQYHYTYIINKSSLASWSTYDDQYPIGICIQHFTEEIKSFYKLT